MFIERLTISSADGVIRDVHFGPGLNLIVDDTAAGAEFKTTGNNVGKTTVLRLIDYCLGGSQKQIYADPEGGQSYYAAVKSYLEEKRVEVTLKLVHDLSRDGGGGVTIRRNFLRGKSCLREIDGEQVPAKDFTGALGEALFPSLPADGKPSFRQVIGHNIRIDDHRLSHTLQFLNQNTKGIEYEPVYLYMLGCAQEGMARKQDLAEQEREERAFAKKISPGRGRDYYEAAIRVLDSEIGQLEEQRERFGVIDGFADLLRESDNLALRIAQTRSEMSRVDIRIGLIEDAERALLDTRSSVDTGELRALYDEASSLLPSLQRTFEQLVDFHNAMVDERIRFIKSDLPDLEDRRRTLSGELDELLSRDKEVSAQLSTRITSEELEQLLSDINSRYQRKGEFGSILKQLEESERRLDEIRDEIAAIEEHGAEAGLWEEAQRRIDALNEDFGRVSNSLYGETYFVQAERKTDRNGVPYFSMKVEATNVSTGKKQGEILCFDIGYTRFADRFGIDCLHFVLNDKKELVHGNQLEKIDKVARENGVQVVISMLRDKLPASLADGGRFVVLSLSQDDKLFRMEEFS